MATTRIPSLLQWLIGCKSDNHAGPKTGLPAPFRCLCATSAQAPYCRLLQRSPAACWGCPHALAVGTQCIRVDSSAPGAAGLPAQPTNCSTLEATVYWKQRALCGWRRQRECLQFFRQARQHMLRASLHTLLSPLEWQRGSVRPESRWATSEQNPGPRCLAAICPVHSHVCNLPPIAVLAG